MCEGCCKVAYKIEMGIATWDATLWEIWNCKTTGLHSLRLGVKGPSKNEEHNESIIDTAVGTLNQGSS